jgi:hypothetical protein
MGNNPIKTIDPEGDFLLFFTDLGYDIQKRISPVALHFNINKSSGGGFNIGVEASVGLPQSMPFSYRWHYGASYYSSSSYDGGVSGYTSTNGKEVSYLGLLRLSSTQYHSKGEDGSSSSQTTGLVTIGAPGFNIKYQNDFQGTPALFRKLAIGMELGDDGDRWRTAALQINLGFSKFGFNLFTGDPGGVQAERSFSSIDGHDTYDGGTSDKYRFGAVYYGFGPLRFGSNSEKNRHVIQNRFAHDFLQGGEAKWFRVLPRKPRFYWSFGTGYGSGLW